MQDRGEGLQGGAWAGAGPHTMSVAQVGSEWENQADSGFIFPLLKKYVLRSVCEKQQTSKLSKQQTSQKPNMSFIFNSAQSNPDSGASAGFIFG